MDDVQCKDCGFLAVREFSSRRLAEADAQSRATGSSPPGPDARFQLYLMKPICFMRAQVLHAVTETEELKATEFLAIISQPRQCAQFTPWKQGFSPKEHLELDLKEREREWQRAESEAQRKWQADQEEKADKRHRDNLDRVARSSKANVVAILLAGTISAVATFAAAYLAQWSSRP